MHQTRGVLAVVLIAAALGCGGDGKGGTAPEAPVAKVSLTGAPGGPSLVGSTMQLTAVPQDANGTSLSGRPITWASTNTAVATVTDVGLVTGVGPGQATVTASSGGQSASVPVDFRVGGALGTEGGSLTLLGGAFTLTVPNGALAQPAAIMVRTASPAPSDPRLAESITYEVWPASLTLAKPATLILKYDKQRMPAGLSEASLLLGRLNGAAWSPVSGSVVDPTTTTVSGAVTGGGTYAVLSADVDHLQLLNVPALGHLYVGQSVQLSAIAYDASNNPLAGRPTTWLSSNPNAITVAGTGYVSAVGVGTATITATIGGKSASTTIVTSLVPVATVLVSPASGALYATHQLQLTAAVQDSAGGALTGRGVTWVSSDPQIASVDANGKVSALKEGAVTITATSESKAGTSRLTVLAKVVADWSQAAEWTTFQGNASHSGYVNASVDPDVFKEQWVQSPLGTSGLNPVTTGDGSVLVSSMSYFGSQLVASLSVSTGTVKWSYNFGNIASVDPPAYANGTMYVQTGGQQDSYLWGFDANTGAIKFRTAYGNQWSLWYAPTIVDQTVYAAGGTYGGMYAFSSVDGSVKWSAALNQYDQLTPAVRDGVVYAYTGSYTPEVTVADATTGSVKYQIPDPNFSWNGWSMNVAPALGDMNDLFATQAGRLVAFDLGAKTLKWQKTANFSGNVTVAHGALYVANGSQLEAHNEADGSLLWLWVPPDRLQLVNTNIATNNLLFVSTTSHTYAIDIGSHQQVWSYPAGGALALSKQGLLFIAQQNGRLAAVKVQ
ncbi:MAG: Ig-like domain-containing protein [Gemmatimonadaceae bacterium]